MDFNELDKKMRRYECGDDRLILPEIYLVARIDGRGFTKLTKQECKFEAPFDVKFRDLMVDSVRHLMTSCGFKILYGYTESDEISVLFHPEDAAFQHKARKLISLLAGETSAAFSVGIGKVAAFDCRLCELPNKQLVIDYFRWRNEDANRNALNSHCYWMLRKQGKSVREATAMVSGKSVAEKNEMLFQGGINFNNLPSWQKRGVGLRWGKQKKEGFNPIMQRTETTVRNSLTVDYELPMGDAYTQYIDKIIVDL